MDRRTSIVTATNELFRAQGYRGTSLSQISEASGATIGSIYHCFPGGKVELTEAVIADTAAVYRELFVAIVTEADDPVSAYRAFFAAAAATLEENAYLDPCPIGTIAREVASSDERLRRAAEAAFTSWISAVGEHLVGAGVPEADATRLANVFVMAVEGGFVVSRTLRRGDPLVAAGATLAPLVAAAIGERRPDAEASNRR